MKFDSTNRNSTSNNERDPQAPMKAKKNHETVDKNDNINQPCKNTFTKIFKEHREKGFHT